MLWGVCHEPECSRHTILCAYPLKPVSIFIVILLFTHISTSLHREGGVTITEISSRLI